VSLPLLRRNAAARCDASLNLRLLSGFVLIVGLRLGAIAPRSLVVNLRRLVTGGPLLGGSTMPPFLREADVLLRQRRRAGNACALGGTTTVIAWRTSWKCRFRSEANPGFELQVRALLSLNAERKPAQLDLNRTSGC